jgi:hypothetical protein
LIKAIKDICKFLIIKLVLFYKHGELLAGVKQQQQYLREQLDQDFA